MYKKNNNFERKYLVLIILLIIAIFLGFAVKIVNTDRKLNSFEKIIKDSVLFVNKIVYSPFRFIEKEVNKAKEKENIYNKYQDILKEKRELDLIGAKNDELTRELKQMKELLELNSTLEKESYLSATVINRNIDYFSNTLTLDKGENNGVKIDMAVVVKNGLVGKVIKTTNFSSTVKLLTSDDMNNKISVKIKVNDKYIYGLLSGYDKKNKSLIIEGIDTNDEITINSIVTTTGLGNIFPSGILVGKVKNIRKDNFDLAKIVEVESDVDFNDIAFVTILKRSDND